MDEDTRFTLAAIYGALIVNAKYSALTFFQASKGAPLTAEEMKEVADGVLREFGPAAREAYTALLSDEGS